MVNGALKFRLDDIHIKTGDIITLNVLGTPMIILNSVESATDLLEKRSINFSDRPDMPMIKDL